MNTTENSFILYVCFHRCPERHVQTRTMETDRAESCRKRLKHDDMNVSINTVLKNIFRAGNATCMKRSMQDDMNGT
jgi:heterodisulfide reductase subunit C